MSYYLIGHPLGHSCSPELHSYFGNEDYQLLDLRESELKGFIKRGNFDGLNVTIPFKSSVAACMDMLSPRARETGAVNTVVRTRDGRLMGDNTDIDGMERMILSAGIDLEQKNVVILGTGGTAHTADYIANKHGATKVRHVSRCGPINYQNVYEECRNAQVLINTTPVGMYPDLDGRPVDLNGFPELEALIDVIYNPLRTALTQQAKRLGIPHVNGLKMLVEQARSAEELFFARAITDEEADAAYDRLQRRHTNIVLIGMPGSGKTSVGRLLAAQSGRQFYDTDQMIVDACGMEIPAIFERYGEHYFREREKEAVKRAAGHQGVIIAVGGGAPISDDNKDYLRMNGRIYLLERSLSMLDRKGRPLSSSAKVLEKMFEVRMPHYLALTDRKVSNHETLEHCAQLIGEDFHNYASIGD